MGVLQTIKKLFKPNPEAIASAQEGGSKFLWIIDPGHGEKTAGKRSPVLPDGRQYFEYDSNYEIANEIKKSLDEIGIDSILTYNSPIGVDNNLKERVRFANSLQTTKNKIFVSIHSNAGPTANPEKDWNVKFSGVETWYNYNSVEGKKLAAIFQRSLVDGLWKRDRGIKTSNPSFYVLRDTKMPAILTESLFYNNPDEVLLLLDGEFRKKIAYAHVNAIVQVEEANGFYNSLKDVRRMLQPEIQKRIAKAHVDAILLIEKEQKI